MYTYFASKKKNSEKYVFYLQFSFVLKISTKGKLFVLKLIRIEGFDQIAQVVGGSHNLSVSSRRVDCQHVSAL